MKTLTDPGIQYFELENISIRPYNTIAVPLNVFSAQLSNSHIFIVTHNESVGLSVLEAAHCGAFILAPENTINPDRLDSVKNMTFHGSINWDKVIHKLTPELNALFVKSQNGDSVASNILKGLFTMRKYHNE